VPTPDHPTGLACPPKYFTLRNPARSTFGPRIEQAHRALTATKQGPGAKFMPHQRYIADVSQEVDPDTGHRWYDTVVVVLPRQAGKTTSIEGLSTWSGNRDDKPDTTSVYLAQDRQLARVRVIDEWETKRLARSPATRGRYRARRSNGSEGVTWKATNNKLLVQASTDEAGHGLTIDGEAIVDEAWAHKDLTIIQALSPTMVTCPDAQLWVISTKGAGDDGLLQHFEDIGSAATADPESRIAFFEWSAPDGAPITDPATWWQTIPSLGHTVTERALRQQLLNLGEAEFDRAFLCRRNTMLHESKISPEVWAAQLRHVDEALPQSPVVLVLEIEHDRSAAAIIAVAATGRPGELVGIVDRRPGTSWLLPEARRLQRERRPAAIIGDRRGPIGSMIERLEAELGPILQPDTLEFSQAAGQLLDELDQGLFVHVGQAELDVAVAQARTRPLGDLWAWSRMHSPCGIATLCGVTLGVWGHRKLFPTAHRGRIH
jgi:hypothetical protein